MRVLVNKQRGCGHLKKGAVYLHSEVSEGGVLPPIVLFEPALPWPEEHFRGWKAINGLQFDTLLGPVTVLPWSDDANAGYASDFGVRCGIAFETEEQRHDFRLAAWLAPALRQEASVSVRPLVEAMEAFDLLMWVGESYYPTPQHFVDEVVLQGLNKRLAMRKPPRILPGYTRVFLAHKAGTIRNPDGTESKGPVIFGYAYVTDVFYTKPDDMRTMPSAMDEWRAAGLLEIVEVGPEEGQPGPLGPEGPEGCQDGPGPTGPGGPKEEEGSDVNTERSPAEGHTGDAPIG